MTFTYDYPRPALSADCVLFAWQDQTIKVLLIQRKHEPFAKHWALPGGFVDIDEDLPTAAARELEEETHLKRVKLFQLAAYGAVERDPRTRVVTVAHWGLVTSAQMKQAVAGDDAALTCWFDVNKLPKLAFDHQVVMNDARRALRLRTVLNSFGKEWLPKRFSAVQLAGVYQAASERKESPKRLLTRLMKLGLVKESKNELFEFETKTYRKYQNEFLLFS